MNTAKWVIAIDPDTKTPGVAFFMDGHLTEAFATSESVDRVFTHLHMAKVLRNHLMVIECPQTYGGRAAGSSDANDLITLARLVGRFEQMAIETCCAVRVVTPHEWKGNVPKHITVQRAWDELTDYERSVVKITDGARAKLIAGDGLKSGAGCDTMDAVALGLRALGRTGRRLV